MLSRCKWKHSRSDPGKKNQIRRFLWFVNYIFNFQCKEDIEQRQMLIVNTVGHYRPLSIHVFNH